MSRLDSFILRLQAQRACLEAARAMTAHLVGPVLELGLGNGRTFDHLRERFADREIFVFERQPAPHPACMPDPDHLIVGELEATLPGAGARLPGRAVLVHSDIGCGDPARDQALAAWLAGILPSLMVEGGILVSDQPMDDKALQTLPLPEELPVDRYFLYRRLNSGRAAG
jgi:hypothetical protein